MALWSQRSWYARMVLNAPICASVVQQPVTVLVHVVLSTKYEAATPEVSSQSTRGQSLSPSL